MTNVTSLLKTVKAVEDEHTRGTRALESTIEAISQEIEVFMSVTLTKCVIRRSTYNRVGHTFVCLPLPRVCMNIIRNRKTNPIKLSS